MAWSENARRAALEARRRKQKGGDYYRFAESNPDPEAPLNQKRYGSRKGLLSSIAHYKKQIKTGQYYHLGGDKRDPGGNEVVHDPKEKKFYRKKAMQNLKRARQALYGRQPKKGKRQYERAKTFTQIYGH